MSQASLWSKPTKSDFEKKEGISSLLKQKGQLIKEKTTGLLSRKSKLIAEVGILVIGLMIAGYNVYGKDEVTVKAEDSSILVGVLFPEEEQYETVVSDPTRKPGQDNYLSAVSVASAAGMVAGSMNGDLAEMADGEIDAETMELAFLGDDTLISNSPVSPDIDEEAGKKIQKYTVAEGDTIMSIADKYKVDAATILTENNLYADDIIKVGMELRILPVSGTAEKVDKGETIEQIAERHEAKLDKIMAYNNLIDTTDIEENMVLIIPDGKREIKERPKPPVQHDEPTVVAASPSTSSGSRSYSPSTPVVQRGPSVGNRFQWGWCTWYVAERRGDVTWRGNAGTWLGGAQAAGRATGRVPAVGAIMVTNESWWGHVAYVEAVNGNMITVSEMNYKGFGITSTRTLSSSSGTIKGFIY